MRYLLWQLNWIDNYGYGPEDYLPNLEAVLTPSSFRKDSPNGQILGYLHGNINVEDYSVFSLVEITKEEALAFAKSISSNATFHADGRLTVAGYGTIQN